MTPVQSFRKNRNEQKNKKSEEISNSTVSQFQKSENGGLWR